MKITKLHFILLGLLALAAFSACSGSKEPSALVAQCERINGELGKMAEDSPMFLDSITCNYDDKVITVNIAFADSAVTIGEFTEAFVEYTLAQYLKSHTGPNLDMVLNTLGKEEGQMKINISAPGQASRTYAVTSLRLKQLVTLKNSELNFAEVRTAVIDMLARRCPQYRENVNAEDCTFDYSGKFAQYTLVFKNTQAFSNQNPGTLQGRYRNVLRPLYESYGACGPFIIDLLKSLQFDGYRFVYTDADGSKEIKAAIAWKYIE